MAEIHVEEISSVAPRAPADGYDVGRLDRFDGSPSGQLDYASITTDGKQPTDSVALGY